MTEVDTTTARPSAEGAAPAADGRPVTMSCLIMTSPRTGSWLLSDILSSTGLVGQPDEYFRLDFAHDIARDLGLKTRGLSRAYLEGIVRLTASDNGVFGAKIHPHHFAKLTNALRNIEQADAATTDAELMARWFPNPRYVHLVRTDTSRQAISYYRALQSGVWWELEEEEAPEPEGPGGGRGGRGKGRRGAKGRGPRTPRVRPDYLQIKWLEDLVVQYEKDWAAFFTSSGIEPHEVVYEELVENTDEVMMGVLEYLGVELPPGFSVPTSRVRRLADQSTERQLRAYGDLRDILPPMPVGWGWNLDASAFTPLPRDPGPEAEDDYDFVEDDDDEDDGDDGGPEQD